MAEIVVSLVTAASRTREDPRASLEERSRVKPDRVQSYGAAPQHGSKVTLERMLLPLRERLRDSLQMN